MHDRIDRRCNQEPDCRGPDHASKDRHTDRLTGACSSAGGDSQWNDAQDEGHRSHHHRPEALFCTHSGSFLVGKTIFAPFLCELDDQDRILGRQADEENDGNLYVEAVLQPEDPQRTDCPEKSCSKRKDHDERQRPAFVLRHQEQIGEQECKCENQAFCPTACLLLERQAGPFVITNDIYTKEDALILARRQAISEDRILGVETGGCPHTAIREDASINLQAVAEMNRKFPDLDIVFIESGGDNLAATFSPDLADLTLYVISVCQGEEIPRKGGPGITRSDFLVINKSDLAPYVNVDLDVMAGDARRMRNDRPFGFTDLSRGKGLETVIDFITATGGLDV